MDTQTVALGNANGWVNLYNLESSKRVHRIEGIILLYTEHCMAVRSLKYCSEHNLLVSGSDDLHINLIDLTNNKVIQALVGHKESITSIQFNKELNLFSSSSLDGTIKLWDFRSRTSSCVQTLSLNNDNIIWDFSFSENGDYLFAATENNGLAIFNKN